LFIILILHRFIRYIKMTTRQTGAEFIQVAAGLSTDLVEIQRYTSASPNPYWATYNITLANLLTGGIDFTTLNLGASGTAGALNIFPATASKGNLKFVATNNTGNTITTITNAAMAEPTTISIPDPGASTASFVLNAGSQTIGGVKTFSSIPIGTAQAIQISINSIAAQAGAVWVLFQAPFAGTITSVAAAISGAITSTNLVITPSVYHSGTPTAITGGAVTINESGSGIASSATVTPSAANTFAAGDTVTATVTGGVGSVNGVITLYVTRTS
jgi:hypothetical protein